MCRACRNRAGELAFINVPRRHGAPAPFFLLYNQRFCMTVTTFQAKLASAGTRQENYRGAETVASFGDTPNEFRALLEACGLFDMSWQAKLVLTGEDRVRWLNGTLIK